MASGAEHEIRSRIGRRGPITFREFMELALYWPDGGYYTTRAASADYYTAPAAHPAFGALLCLQLYQAWTLLGKPHPFWIIEPGAGNGLLGRDIAAFSSQLADEFSRTLRYVCVERCPCRHKKMPTGGGQEWLGALDLPFRQVVGVILSNELLDAFPVHRVRMEQGALREVYVTVAEGRLVEELGAPSTPALEERLQQVGVSLEEGWEAEINLSIDDWAAEVAACLDRGLAITVDYGRSAAELYSAERRRGTLTTFRNHVQTDSPLRDVGYQDITAQVDFTALDLAGRDAGLECWGRTSQRLFLLNMGMQRWLSSLRVDLGEVEANANRMGMQQLIRLGGMGDFQVMFQAKGVDPTDLWGLEPSQELEALLDDLVVPRLSPEHVPLLEGNYPHLAESYEYLWPDAEVAESD